MALNIDYIAPTLKTNSQFNFSDVEAEIKPGLQAIAAIHVRSVSGGEAREATDEEAEYMTAIAITIYDYAVNGILPDWDHATSNDFTLDMSAFLRGARTGEELCSTDGIAGACEHVFALAIVRNKLDYQLGKRTLDSVVLEPCDDPFTIKEAALLARMSEGGVRNDTLKNSTTKNRLAVRRVGKNVVIDAPELASWLYRTTKGVVPTRS